MSEDLTHWSYKSALLIVAHPDDEILWAGGTALMHPETRWIILSLCRRSDPERAPKFRKVLDILGAQGDLGDLDDGPEQTPLPPADVQSAVLALTGSGEYDLILTHSRSGEYTRHRRHEEVGAAVLDLWDAGRIASRELWTFAYHDSEPAHIIQTIKGADIIEHLPEEIWKQKLGLITDVYGFAPDSFEANAALHQEAFWKRRVSSGRTAHESFAAL